MPIVNQKKPKKRHKKFGWKKFSALSNGISLLTGLFLVFLCWYFLFGFFFIYVRRMRVSTDSVFCEHVWWPNGARGEFLKGRCWKDDPLKKFPSENARKKARDWITGKRVLLRAPKTGIVVRRRCSSWNQKVLIRILNSLIPCMKNNFSFFFFCFVNASIFFILLRFFILFK